MNTTVGRDPTGTAISARSLGRSLRQPAKATASIARFLQLPMQKMRVRCAMVTFTDCQKSPDSDACKIACTASTGLPTTTPGFSKEACNVLYNQFCADPTNRALPICACNQPWSSYPGSAQVSQYFPNVQEPRCWFAGCKATGYMTNTPGNLCPACLQTLTVDIENATQSGVADIAQTCSVSTSTSVGGAASSSTTTTSGSPQATSGTSSTDRRVDGAIDTVESFALGHPLWVVGGAGGLLTLVILLLLFRK